MATKLGKKERNGKVVIGVYIAKDTHAKLIKIAKARELNLSDIVRVALKEYVASNERASSVISRITRQGTPYARTFGGMS